MRSDIFSHVPEGQMTLDQLTFRRNGYLHDIQSHHKRGQHDMRSDVAESQKCLERVEALIVKKIAETKAAEARTDGQG
jgi:hypothetical protein